jgi:hypothetical protein
MHVCLVNKNIEILSHIQNKKWELYNIHLYDGKIERNKK